MSNYISQDGLWDTIKKIGSGASDIVKSQATEEGRAAAYRDIAAQQIAQQPHNRAGGMPGWLLPVGIGAGVLVLFLVLKKK